MRHAYSSIVPLSYDICYIDCETGVEKIVKNVKVLLSHMKRTRHPLKGFWARFFNCGLDDWELTYFSDRKNRRNLKQIFDELDGTNNGYYIKQNASGPGVTGSLSIIFKDGKWVNKLIKETYCEIMP